ncbi:unnamed protein product, partial [Rotaria magnacalcarata]
LAVIEQQVQAMAAVEQNEDDNDEQYEANEKITTEDILGNISESDSSDDDNDTRQSLSMFS